MSRQISTQSNISLPDMSVQIMNIRVTEEHSLYHICLAMLKRLNQLPALKPYITLSKSTAEILCEKQAFLITQNNNTAPANMHSSLSALNNPRSRLSSTVSKVTTPSVSSSAGRGYFDQSKAPPLRASSSSSSTESSSPVTNENPTGGRFSTTSLNSTSSSLNSKNDLLTFSIGVMPPHVECDPVTQLSKLFQLGSPLCIIFNNVKPQYKLPVVSSDDLKICKKSIYDFICACKIHLAFNDEELFTISDTFSNSTDNLMKIIDVINSLMDSAPKIFPSVAIEKASTYPNNMMSPGLSAPNSPMNEQLKSGSFSTFQRFKQGDTSSSNADLPSPSNPYNAFVSSSVSSVSVGTQTTTAAQSESSIKDERYRIFRELLETERKYVYDLEILQDFNYQLVQENIINIDESNMLFPNIQEIIEFQRRFLISLESNNNINFNDQTIGSIFLHSQSFFRLYEPWSIGQTAAIDYISALPIFQTHGSSLIIKNKLELQAFLLKPVQRLCKYPLLLKELVQSTPSDCSNLKQLEAGWEVSKSVAQSINENQRKTENHEITKKLGSRVQNWKGYNLAKFGDLLFSDAVIITTGSTSLTSETGISLNNDQSQSNKQYEVYLFEKIIVLFTPITPTSDKRSTSSSLIANGSGSNGDSSTKNSLMKTASSTLNLKKNKSNAQVNNVPPLMELNLNSKLDLKGRIMVATIDKINSLTDHGLSIQWDTTKEQGLFVFKFKNDETRDNWFTCLTNLMKQYSQAEGSFSSFNTPIVQQMATYSNGNSSSMNKIRSSSLSSTNSLNSTTFENSGKLTNSIISATTSSISPTGTQTKRNSRRSSGNNLRLSSSSNHHSQRHQHYNSIVSLNSLHNITENSSHTSLASATRQATSTSAFENEYRTISENYKHSIPDSQLLCRIQFQNDFYTVLISTDSDFAEAFENIQRKLSHIGDMQKLKYQDEDGDYVMLQSDEDWEMVKEWLKENNESMLNIIAYK